MRVLITGLCLQGNKGGPALALSLMKVIGRYVEPCEFVFSVPSGSQWPHESEWAGRYGVSIVKGPALEDVSRPFAVKYFPDRIRRLSGWVAAARKSDVVVDMTAISYVGTGGRRELFVGGRLNYFLLARIARRPFLAWTQSYGPLSNKLARTLAAWDLKRQPVVFCRGEECLREVKSLLPDKEARSYPDVAVVLDYDPEWGRDYLARNWAGADRGKLVTISPSAVIHSRTKDSAGSSGHVEEIVCLCDALTGMGYEVVLVPHTFRPGVVDPNMCDLAASRLVAGKAARSERVHLMEEDLSPVELKSVISRARVHVGGRYHSIVAALSSGVPCIAMSWHPKYRDIMEMYGLGEFVHDGENASAESLVEMFEKVSAGRDDYAGMLANAQSGIEEQIDENARLFTDLMKEAVSR